MTNNPEDDTSGFVEIDLDNLDALDDAKLDVEIVAEVPGAQEQTTSPNAPAANADEDDDEGVDPGADAEPASIDGEAPRKRPTRTTRLKAVADRLRDDNAQKDQQLADLQAKLDAMNQFQAKALQDGLAERETYVTNQFSGVQQQLRVATENGEWETAAKLQGQLAELAVAKHELAGLRKANPAPQANPTQAGATQPTQNTTPSRAAQAGTPEQRKMLSRAKDWGDANPQLQTDPVFKATAMALADKLAAEGYDGAGEEFWDQLDKEMRKELPHKFAATAKRAPQAVPVNTGRAATAAAGGPAQGKLRVEITAEDRRNAASFGMTIKEWAVEKAKIEAAGDGGWSVG